MLIDHETSQPDLFLVENIDLLARGKALDIAMGEGVNTVYLASKGFEVKGVDRSAEAVQKALQLAERYGVHIAADVGDLEKDYKIEQDAFDVIICFHYLQRTLIPQIKSGLRKGGMVVYETYIIDQASLFGKPKNPDYLLQHNELLNMFRDFRCLLYREGVIENKKAIAGIVAQKI